MHWDAATQSAVAKHELEYKQVTDTSLYMKFPHRTRKNTFFIIWTTTPRTIPLNLAIMVNPELYYTEVKVQGETWILAKERVQYVLRKAGQEEYTISKEYLGTELEGQYYDHPLHIKPFLPQDLQKNPRLFSVLLSAEYVDAVSGTGLVHCAPGCGPEDYEVGHQYHIPPFNCVNADGLFQNFGPFTNWKAKLDDKKFIDAIEQSGSLLAKEAYSHEYPHGERSHQPVIFRTTKQWFFKVEDLRQKMLAANKNVYWNPQSGKNAFISWLENLRDNSITKQRYWGTPVPIWQADDGDYLVLGSVEELEKLSKTKVKNMHIPDIDQITITKNKKIYKRIPDVLDVWIDAGTVSWNCLDRHVINGKRNKVAYIWEAENGETKVYTYGQLLREVCKFADILKKKGVSKGDVVQIYLPMIPELPISILACARIGAIHSVVFGGFSSEALKDRIQDSSSVMLITADGSFRNGKVFPLKENADMALKECPTVKNVIVVQRANNKVNMEKGRDHWLHELDGENWCWAESMHSEDSLSQ